MINEWTKMKNLLIIGLYKAFSQGESHVRNGEWVGVVHGYNDVRNLGNDAVCHWNYPAF